MTRRTGTLAMLIVLLLVMCAPTTGADNPTQVIVSAAGDTIVLPAVAGKRYRIHAMAVLATSTDSVSFYLHNDDNNLFGDSSNKVTVDLDGADGPSGMVLHHTDYGWFTSDAANEAVEINLSDASRPVIVLLVFSYF